MRICIVDREAIVRQTLADFLEELGHQVSLFASHNEMVEAAEDGYRAQIVIMDEDLEREQLFWPQKLHQKLPQVPVVLMAILGGVLSAKEALDSGVIAILRKPFRMSELELLISVVEKYGIRKEPCR
jgi:DNA-binding NtrC family response regulator